MMSRIRSTGNQRTDKAVASMLRRADITGYRRHVVIKLSPTKSAMGVASDGTKFKPQVRPDFVFRKNKVALFIDGCFWHGCPRCYTAPIECKKILERKGNDQSGAGQVSDNGAKKVRMEGVSNLGAQYRPTPITS
jgi:DNA mismatch endonuclease (patch repair protein)